MKSQKPVSVYFTSEQILYFGFAEAVQFKQAVDQMVVFHRVTTLAQD